MKYRRIELSLSRCLGCALALLLWTASTALAADIEEGPSGLPVVQFDTIDAIRDSSENFRFTIDLSHRAVYFDNRGGFGTVTALGIDSHKVFTNENGDWATLTLQGYLTKIDDMPGAPPFFETPDDWEFVFRIFNANFALLSRQRLNLRVGHFEVPFGLEHSINTNGTLRDFTHGANLGIKADWGVSLNGVLPSFEYEFGVTRGVADEADGERTYLFAGRVGTPSDNAFVAGLSAMHGRISNERAVGLWKASLETPQPDADKHILRRSRIGLDLQWHTEWASLLTEVSWGEDFDREVLNLLMEVDREVGPATTLYLQGRRFAREWDSDWDHATTLALGFRYAPDAHWSIDAQVERELHTFGPRPGDARVGAQLRYRY